MFPTLRVSFSDVDPGATYAVMLDIIPVDTKRHRYSYSDSAWFVAGEGDVAPPRVTCVHPDSPFTGQQLLRQVLSFEKVKLTNNRDDKRGNVSARHQSTITDLQVDNNPYTTCLFPRSVVYLIKEY